MKTTYKKQNNIGFNFIKQCLFAVFMLATAGFSTSALADSSASSADEAKVIGLRYNNVHILDLEKTMVLYREILGFELVGAEVLKGALSGMLVLKIKAGDYMMTLTLTPPQFSDSLAPVGNTNHNHFMLRVNDIGPIGDKLKEAGYELENDNYVNDLYTFFTGPNGEIIGLSSWVD